MVQNHGAVVVVAVVVVVGTDTRALFVREQRLIDSVSPGGYTHKILYYCCCVVASVCDERKNPNQIKDNFSHVSTPNIQAVQ